MNKFERDLQEKGVLSVSYLQRKYKMEPEEAYAQIAELAKLCKKFDRNSDGEIERVFFDQIIVNEKETIEKKFKNTDQEWKFIKKNRKSVKSFNS